MTCSTAARSPRFWLLAAFFALFVLFLYGPTITILILSFQGPDGGLTFPMNGVSLHWFANLFEKQMVGDFAGSFERSLRWRWPPWSWRHRGRLVLGRPRFPRALPRRGACCSISPIASLIVPSILISLGIGLLFRCWIGTRPGTARPSARTSPGPCRSGC